MAAGYIAYRFFGNEYDQVHIATVDVLSNKIINTAAVVDRISERFAKMAEEDPVKFFRVFGLEEGWSKILSHEFYECRVYKNSDFQMTYKEEYLCVTLY